RHAADADIVGEPRRTRIEAAIEPQSHRTGTRVFPEYVDGAAFRGREPRPAACAARASERRRGHGAPLVAGAFPAGPKEARRARGVLRQAGGVSVSTVVASERRVPNPRLRRQRRRARGDRRTGHGERDRTRRERRPYEVRTPPPGRAGASERIPADPHKRRCYSELYHWSPV